MKQTLKTWTAISAAFLAGIVASEFAVRSEPMAVPKLPARLVVRPAESTPEIALGQSADSPRWTQHQ